MEDKIARKSFCADDQHTTEKGTLVVVPLFNSVPAAAYHLILTPLSPNRLEQGLLDYVDKSLIAKWLHSSRSSQPIDRCPGSSFLKYLEPFRHDEMWMKLATCDQEKDN